MVALPIVLRELRTASRRPATYRLRVGFALGVVLVGATVLVSAGGVVSPAKLASMLFLSNAIVTLAFAMLAGVFLTADCISAERRDGTLGLLFLTDLDTLDVLLGKLASTSLHAFYGLAAAIPMMAVPLIIGGVSAGEFSRLILTLGLTLAASLSVGLAVSSLALHPRDTYGATLMILGTAFGVLPSLWWVQKELLNWPSLAPLLLWPSPGFAFWALQDSVYLGSRVVRHDFWGSMAVLTGIAAGSLASAAFVLPRRWKDGNLRAPTDPRPTPTRKESRSEVLALVRRAGETRAARHRSLLDSHPYQFLADRAFLTRHTAHRVLGKLMAVWLVIWFAAVCSDSELPWQPLVFLGAYVLHVFLKILIAFEAPRQLGDDRASGALELLLVSPLRPLDILRGQFQSLLRGFRRLALGALGINLLLILLTFIRIRGNSDRGIFLTILVGGTALLVADVLTLFLVGIRQSLHAKSHVAAFRTLLWVAIPGWGGILLIVMLGMSQAINSSESITVAISIWILASLSLDVIAAVVAFRELRGDGFRLLVTETKAPARPQRKQPRMT